MDVHKVMYLYSVTTTFRGIITIIMITTVGSICMIISTVIVIISMFMIIVRML